MKRFRLPLGSISWCFLTVVGIASSVGSVSGEVIEACAKSVVALATLVPAKLGGSVHELRHFVEDVRANRDRLAAARKPEEVAPPHLGNH
jgi:hypothetical protein